jgi:adenosine deaminase
VKTGIIICLDRTFDRHLNEILLEKALKYKNRGVVGIDIAGSARKGFRYSDCKPLYKRARKEGLGLTVHAGEDEGHNSVKDVLEHLEPQRIGHGVRATEDEETLEMLRERGVVLELCPSSNLNTRVLKGVGDMKRVFRQLNASKVKYTINTDGPEMLLTNLRRSTSSSGTTFSRRTTCSRRTGTPSPPRSSRPRDRSPNA